MKINSSIDALCNAPKLHHMYIINNISMIEEVKYSEVTLWCNAGHISGANIPEF